MVEEISIRDVGNEQIYDSYMGILRISPSQLDNQLTDSMSLFLTNPVGKNESSDANGREVILSDSDGTNLGLYFTSRVRETNVKNEAGKSEKQNVINIVTHPRKYLFATNSLNVRTTLVVNKEKQTDKKSPIQIYHESQSNIGSFDVLAYPIESPNDGDYFNAENKLSLIDYTKSKDVHTQLNESLYNKPKSWYDSSIEAKHRVKIGGDFIYTQNKDYEQVPVLYTREYVLGHCNGHTARVTSPVKTNIVDTTVGPERLTDNKSLITKLSFIRLDTLVWDVLQEATIGNLRQSEGRYSFLGVGQNQSITDRLFGKINPQEEKAPILATGVSPGIVMYHAMPFRRFIFHVLRQEIRNSEDEGNTYKNLRNGVKAYVDAKKITAVKKLDPGFVNTLTKEFVLCDGRELTYDNYPSVNTDNKSLFQHDDKGIVKRDSSSKKPLAATTKSDAYTAMAASNSSTTAPNGNANKVVVPSLLALNQQSPRYLRGLNWIINSNANLDKPIEIETTTPSYTNNSYKHEVVVGSEYGLTQKNFANPGVYRMQADWKATEQRHKHRCFYNSATSNFDNPSTNDYDPNNENLPTTFDINEIISNGDLKKKLMNYSFIKHATVEGQRLQNAWYKATPVPFAGLFAWKINSGTTQTGDAVQSGYVIQNAKQTAISSNASVRLKQLELINYAEGMAPIANKGGRQNRGHSTSIHCTQRHHHRTRRFRGTYTATFGAYDVQKATSAAGTDVPRCVTSLPVTDLEKKSDTYEAPYTMKIGNQIITPDMSLSFPPTTVLLPLFKI